jgi:hypothetical protein
VNAGIGCHHEIAGKIRYGKIVTAKSPPQNRYHELNE